MKEKPGIRHMEPWSNVHAELIKSIGRADYAHVDYQSVQPTDRVMETPASEYVLRLAAQLRKLTEEQSRVTDLLQVDFDPKRREHFIVTECDLEFEIGVLMNLYFLELSKEQTTWSSVPMFTLRGKNTVVVTMESDRAYKRLLVRRPFKSTCSQEFFRRLILSPLATVADLPDLSPQKT